jgi:hypothetical protein
LLKLKRSVIESDVIVVGGGMAGTLAALAVARNDLQAVLLEKDFYLGGTATNSLIAEMQGVARNGKLIYSGITREIMNRLIERKEAEYAFQVPMSSNPNIRIDRLRYNVEALKILLDEMMIEAGVKVFYTSPVCKSEIANSHCTVTVRNDYNHIEIAGKILIDATGNADVACQLGYETDKADIDNLQPTTLVFRLSNINIAKTQEFLRDGRISQIIKDGSEIGVLPGKILGIAPIPNTCDVTVNTTRGNMVDHESIESLTNGVIKTRLQIRKLLPFLRENIAGFEQATLVAIAPKLGIRDCRRIIGEYRLTGQDLINQKDFEDSIAFGCYPVDIHDHKVNGVSWVEIEGVYKIPYTSLIPKGAKRLLAAGRCISTDRQAFGAIRVIPIVMCIGESAGYASVLAVKCGCDVNGINVSTLKEVLTNAQSGLN